MKTHNPPILGPHILQEHRHEQEMRQKYGQDDYEKEREEARRPKTVEEQQQNARTTNKSARYS